MNFSTHLALNWENINQLSDFKKELNTTLLFFSLKEFIAFVILQIWFFLQFLVVLAIKERTHLCVVSKQCFCSSILLLFSYECWCFFLIAFICVSMAFWVFCIVLSLLLSFYSTFKLDYIIICTCFTLHSVSAALYSILNLKTKFWKFVVRKLHVRKNRWFSLCIFVFEIL